MKIKISEEKGQCPSLYSIFQRNDQYIFFYGPETKPAPHKSDNSALANMPPFYTFHTYRKNHKNILKNNLINFILYPVNSQST